MRLNPRKIRLKGTSEVEDGGEGGWAEEIETKYWKIWKTQISIWPIFGDTPFSQEGEWWIPSLDLHKFGNELSLDLHKFGNELSLDLHKFGNELSLDLHKSGNELNLDWHKSDN